MHDEALAAGKLAEAERALVAGGVPAQACEMYMRAAKHADALRLCERYHLAGLQEALLALVRQPAFCLVQHSLPTEACGLALAIMLTLTTLSAAACRLVCSALHWCVGFLALRRPGRC